MAKIPIIDNDVASSGVADIGLVDPAGAPGAIIARSFGQLAGAAQDVSMQFLKAEVDARDSAELTKSIGDATKGLSDARIAVGKAPPAERVQRFDALTTTLGDRIKGGITNRQTRLRFEARFTPLSSSMAAGVQHTARVEETEAARSQLIKTNDALVATALGAGSTLERDIAVGQIKENILRAQNTGVLNERAARAATAMALGRLDVHQAAGMIRSNPAAAKAALGDPKQFENLSGAQRVKLVEAAEGRQRALVAKAKAQVATDMAFMLKQAQLGAGTSPEAWTELRGRAKQFGPEFERKIAGAENDASFLAGFLKQSLTEQARSLQVMSKLVGTAGSVAGVKALGGRTAIARKAFTATGGPGALKKEIAGLKAAGTKGLATLRKSLKAEGIAPKALIAETGRAIMKSGDGALAVDFTRFLGDVVFSNRFNQLPAASQAAVTGALRDFAANAPTAEAARAALGRLDLARQAHGDLLTKSRKNPIATAAERKLVDFAPVFFSGTRQVPVAGSGGGFAVITSVDSFRTRRETAKTAAARTGLPVKFLDQTEVLAAKARLERASPARKLEIAGSLVEGFGSDAPKVFAELGLADASFTAVGALVMAGRPGVATRMINGRAFLKNNPKQIPSGTLSAIRRKIAESVLPLFPEIAGIPADGGGAATARLVDSILYVYVNDRVAGGEIGDISEFDSRLLEGGDAVKAVTGGIVTVNGGKALPPEDGLSGDAMERVLRQATPEVFASITGSRPMVQFGGRLQPVPTERLRQAQVMLVAPGEYMLLLPGPNGGFIPAAREILPSTEGGFTGLGAVPRQAALRFKWAALAAAVGLPANRAGAFAGALAGAAAPAALIAGEPGP